MVGRHHLAGDASGPEAAARAMIALHATDPASVYLSVLARSTASTLADVAQAMYDRRSLVRWMAMRRTLFVFPREDIPMIQAAVSTPLAAVLRRRLIGRLERNGTEPPIDDDAGAWLDDLASRVENALAKRGTATGAQLSTDEPELRTSILVRAPSDRPQNVTSSLLTLMSAEGRLVRSTPVGAWTSRHHRWEPVGRWWPDGLPAHDIGRAQQALARQWLTRFGPATVEDLQWWTGWTKATVRRALDNLPVAEIDLHGQPGITLRDSVGDLPDDAHAPVASLLPALDPTPMGWKHRDWFLGIDYQRRIRPHRQHRPHRVVGRRDHRLLDNQRGRRTPYARPCRSRSSRRRGHRRRCRPTASASQWRYHHRRVPHTPRTVDHPRPLVAEVASCAPEVTRSGRPGRRGSGARTPAPACPGSGRTG